MVESEILDRKSAVQRLIEFYDRGGELKLEELGYKRANELFRRRKGIKLFESINDLREAVAEEFDNRGRKYDSEIVRSLSRGAAFFRRKVFNAVITTDSTLDCDIQEVNGLVDKNLSFTGINPDEGAFLSLSRLDGYLINNKPSTENDNYQRVYEARWKLILALEKRYEDLINGNIVALDLDEERFYPIGQEALERAVITFNLIVGVGCFQQYATRIIKGAFNKEELSRIYRKNNIKKYALRRNEKSPLIGLLEKERAEVMRSKTKEMLDSLIDEEKTTITALFGLDGFNGRTLNLSQIGKKINKSRACVGNYRKSAMQQLRNHPLLKEILDYLAA